MYEADSRGSMRKVDAATTLQSKPPPLWKPEVALMLTFRAELKLDHDQKQKIAALVAAWRQERAQLEADIRRAMSDADAVRKEAQTNQSASAGRITSSLGDYSSLSHQFNEERASYWTQAVAILTPEQKSALDRLTSPARNGTSP